MKTLAFWLGFFLFAVYVLSFSGKLHVMDEFVGYAVGNNLVQHGQADVNQYIWTNHWHSTPPGLWGIDDNLYTKKAPGISLAAAPLIWLGHTLPGLSAVHTGLLLSVIITALTGSLLFFWLVDLRISTFIAGLSVLIYGLCTIAWVYARLLWEHSVMALIFLVVMWALYRAIYLPTTRHKLGWVFLCSLAMSTSLTMRFEALPALGLVGAYLFFYAIPLPKTFSFQSFLQILKDKTRWIWLLGYTALPIITTLSLLYFNAVRFGSAGETGYNREILFEKPWVGTFGLLFSPSTGLFIYAPIMLLLFFGLRPAWKKLPHPYFLFIIFITIFYWIFYGSWFSWGSTWVWGPRFLLHTLPLLMLFVAEALTRFNAGTLSRRTRILLWLGVAALAVVGLVFNFLGVVVDLNEHFLRLGRNDNYVFNWAAFPPLGHWRILQEGLTDISWLQPATQGLSIDWSIFIPAFLLLVVGVVGLLWAYWSIDTKANSPAAKIILHPVTYVVVIALTVGLIYQMMLGTAQAELATEQARADASVLATLTAQAQNGDSLLVPMLPFGDVQEITTHLMGFLDKPLPTYAWIESEPRAIQPDERERLWRVANANSNQAWLFERWLTPTDPLGQTAALFNQRAFPVDEQWFTQSGRLTRYALLGNAQPALVVPQDIPFEDGLTLVDFAIMENSVAPGDTLKVRLTWQAAGHTDADSLPTGGLVGFVHLLNEAGDGNTAQHDRLLIDPQQPKQSPLLPGETVSQGYGLQLPGDLLPGSYPLIVGLYTAQNGQRLLRADGNPDDFLYLTNITVE